MGTTLGPLRDGGHGEKGGRGSVVGVVGEEGAASPRAGRGAGSGRGPRVTCPNLLRSTTIS